jgi:hypothetical protein
MAENRERLEKCAKSRAVHASETRVGESERLRRWTGVHADCVFASPAPLSNSTLLRRPRGCLPRDVLQARCAAAPGWTLPYIR